MNFCPRCNRRAPWWRVHCTYCLWKNVVADRLARDRE